jgi:hypothetical protein
LNHSVCVWIAALTIFISWGSSIPSLLLIAACKRNHVLIPSNFTPKQAQASASFFLIYIEETKIIAK